MLQPSAIAIVGIAAELPSGTCSNTNLDHDSFFKFLLKSGESYEIHPSNRFGFQPWKGDGLGHIGTEKGSFLKDIDLFDHIEFGISTRDARAMAPATRKLLEQTFLALLDSGIDYRKQRVGCYTAATSIELTNASSYPAHYESRGSFAGVPAQVANCISNHLDLLGPSIPVDTACSSSQTALHLAVQALLSGDCDAAVVGGSQLNHRLADWINYSQSGVLAKDGKCKPFDDSADGFGRAEACVVIVIKSLKDALRDHDRIYATILGTSSNSTGSGGPPGAPVAEYQIEAMKTAFTRAGKNPTDVSYVEAHATGTAKGDPTEVNWIGHHFQREEELLIGSVKGNIGHTEIAAFLASLSKVLSIFEHGIIPPNVNISKSNAAIRWQEYRLRVPTCATPLPAVKVSRRALIAMSSSGIGGSNGHVVLEAAPEPDVTGINRLEMNPKHPVLLFSGGLSPRSASALADQISEILQRSRAAEWPAAATVLGRRVKQMTWRSFTVAGPGAGVVEFSKPQFCPRDVNPVVFVFSGQGPQHKFMGRELFATFPIFRESILSMDALFTCITGKSMLRDYGIFCSTPSNYRLPAVWPAAITLPAIAMFQMALFDLLTHLGVRPDVVLGHSAGETAVLYASGAASRSMALEVAIIRGRVLSALESAGGTMAALACTPEDAEKLLSEHRMIDAQAVVELACLNTPSAVAISGQKHAIDDVIKRATAADIFARKIRTCLPMHSSMMDACRDEYRSQMTSLFQRYRGPLVPTVTTYSTLTGKLFTGPYDAEYFWRNTRSQVLFTPVIQGIHAASTFVEISPHPVLSSYLGDMAPGSCVLPTIFRQKAGKPGAEYRDMLELLGRLTAVGYNGIDFTLLNGALCSELTFKLPPFPFLKKKFPLFPDTTIADHFHGPLNRSHLRLNRETHPTLAEHVIRGEPIWPAAGFLEMALEFGATTLLDVNLRSLLPLSSENPLSVDVSLDGSHWKITSHLPARGGGSTVERLHADGYLSYEEVPAPADVDISAIRSRCHSHVDSDFYPALSYFSTYGPKFQRVTNFYYNSNEALASIRGVDDSLIGEKSYILHPAVLDACFQVSAYKPFHGDFAPNSYHLPSRIRELVLHRRPCDAYLPAHIYAHVVLSSWTPESLLFNVAIMDDFGKLLCTLKYEAARHELAALPSISSPLHIAMEPLFHCARTRETLTCPTGPEPNTELVSIEAAVMVCALRLQNLLQSSRKNPAKQVIKLCVFGDKALPAARLFSVLSAFPYMAFEVWMEGIFPSAGEIDHLFTVVRHFEGPPPSGVFFDIVLCLDTEPANSPTAPHLHNHSCTNILLPGGSLILVGDLSSMEECIAVVTELGYTILYTNKTPNLEPTYFVLDVQKALWKPETTNLLFDEEDAFVFDYRLGQETELQWNFSGLNPSQPLNVWILAREGRDAEAGFGLMRAVRREYHSWKMYFVSFPDSFSDDMRFAYLRRLPGWMDAELDIVVSATGEPLVPRLVPLATVTQSLMSPKTPFHSLDPDHAVVAVQRTSLNPNIVAVFGSVVQTHPDIVDYPVGSLVVGLQQQAVAGDAVIDLASMCILPPGASFSPQTVDVIPGILTSILALPLLATLSGRSRIRRLRMLITHVDTHIGTTVGVIYQREGFEFSQASAKATMLELARLCQHEPFDLIVSGYSDRKHTQFLRTLLRPSKGRLFLWNRDLTRVMQEDPRRIGDVLDVAISRQYHTLLPPMAVPPQSAVSDANVTLQTSKATFHPDKAYVILGGVGHVGAHVALYMIQNGARHLVITSRSGEATLSKDDNIIVQRIFTFLRGLDYVNIRIEAIDCTCQASMHRLFNSVERDIGGLFLLAAVFADGLFSTLAERDYNVVFAAKTGVFDTLQQTIPTSALDFIVAFSSMTSIFGTGGQANYCAANAALEARVASLPNAFTFVCPAIIDTALMQDRGKSRSNLKHLTEWAISAEEMLLWLDDAIGKHQSGVQFQRYLPTLNWEVMHQTHGMPIIGSHLVPSAHGAHHEQSTSESTLAKAGRIIQGVLNVSEDDFDPNVPLTSYGIDSLSAGRLSYALRSIIEVTQLQLMADSTLADIIHKFSEPLVNSSLLTVKISDDADVPHHMVMANMVRKYADLLEELGIPSVRDDSIPATHTILLTGSTGALGCQLLAQLLRRDDIARIYALNRPCPGGVPLLNRQLAALQKHGLSAELTRSPKLVLIEGDLQLRNFGLCPEIYDALLSSVSHIIHNAWRVHFMASLSDFEGLVHGTYRLLEFAAKSSCSHRPSLSFISTLAVCRNIPSSMDCAPEAPITDPQIAVQSGYGESKWVAERLVQIASKRRYVNANVIRVGLLTGSTTGMWDTKTWVPALVQSGAYIGCLPDGNDSISWISITDAAAAIIDMRSFMNETLHLVHPHPTIWRAVMQPMAEELGVPLVPYAEWFARLRATAGFDTRTTNHIAALKLLEFFELGLKPRKNHESMGLLPKVETRRGGEVFAKNGNAVAAFDRGEVQNWVRYWRDIGYIPHAITGARE